MKYLRYTGPDPKFRGHTGLVQRVRGKWCVQVDDHRHPAAYGWTRINIRHWNGGLSKSHRRVAYSIGYGMGLEKAAQSLRNLAMTAEEAIAAVRSFHDTYPGFAENVRAMNVGRPWSTNNPADPTLTGRVGFPRRTSADPRP